MRIFLILGFLGSFGLSWGINEPDYDTFPVPIRYDMKEFWSHTQGVLSKVSLEQRACMVFLLDTLVEGRVPDKYKNNEQTMVIPASFDFIDSTFASDFFGCLRQIDPENNAASLEGYFEGIKKNRVKTFLFDLVDVNRLISSSARGRFELAPEKERLLNSAALQIASCKRCYDKVYQQLTSSLRQGFDAYNRNGWMQRWGRLWLSTFRDISFYVTTGWALRNIDALPSQVSTYGGVSLVISAVGTELGSIKALRDLPFFVPQIYRLGGEDDFASENHKLAVIKRGEYLFQIS